MTSNKFNDFEIVRIKSTNWSIDNHLANERGTILGMAEDEYGIWRYGIYFDSKMQTWSIEEDLVESTGESSSYKDFYGTEEEE